MALSSGIPVVSIEDSRTDALVGPAAYLAQPDDPRALGAALITVLVEGGVAERLSQAGRERTASWSLQAFAEALSKAYAKILE
jgi:glycosyltransferase involved in cell wall biosynthesis